MEGSLPEIPSRVLFGSILQRGPRWTRTMAPGCGTHGPQSWWQSLVRGCSGRRLAVTGVGGLQTLQIPRSPLPALNRPAACFILPSVLQLGETLPPEQHQSHGSGLGSSPIGFLSPPRLFIYLLPLQISLFCSSAWLKKWV